MTMRLLAPRRGPLSGGGHLRLGDLALPLHARRPFGALCGPATDPCVVAGAAGPPILPLSRRAFPPVPDVISELGVATKAPIGVAKPLHPAFYIDEAYMAAEQERIFSTNWFAAAHTAELANPGDVKVIDAGSNSILLTRDRAGKLNAFYNICRHRGARICSTSSTGCKQLVCPYHWWAYRLGRVA